MENIINSEGVAEETMASTLTNLLVHVVFSTKGRESMINDKYRERLYANIGGIIRSDDAQSLSIGGMPDHIHLAIKIRSNQAVHHKLKTFKEELIEIQDKHGVDYYLEYLWD